jgi:hypothetical protein
MATLRKLARNKVLVPVKIGRALRYDAAEVQNYIEAAKAV